MLREVLHQASQVGTTASLSQQPHSGQPIKDVTATLRRVESAADWLTSHDWINYSGSHLFNTGILLWCNGLRGLCRCSRFRRRLEKYINAHIQTDRQTERGQVHLRCIVGDFRITALSGNECPTFEWIGFYVILTVTIVMGLRFLRTRCYFSVLLYSLLLKLMEECTLKGQFTQITK